MPCPQGFVPNLFTLLVSGGVGTRAGGRFFTKGIHILTDKKLTDEKIAHFKQMLLDEKTKLEAEREQYAGPDREDSEKDASGELSGADMNSSADQATDLYDRERDQSAIENFDRMLAKVNRALAKIDEGTYGLSDIDGTPISEARLEALPYATTTVEQDDQI